MYNKKYFNLYTVECLKIHASCGHCRLYKQQFQYQSLKIKVKVQEIGYD